MSFFSALTVPGLQQHLSFSREDSAILKGYGILFMIFHHVFGLYALPAGVDTAWIAPQLTKAAPIFKICVPIFIFITGYAMGWKTNSSPTFGLYFWFEHEDGSGDKYNCSLSNYSTVSGISLNNKDRKSTRLTPVTR